MSFALQPFQGEASDLDPKVQFSAGHDREQEILDVVKKALSDIANAIGGHVSVSATGHANEAADQPGDSVNLQVTSFLRPVDPTPDAGLEATAGSARNFPPEASTAAPATEDSSPPAAQEPIPLPVVDNPVAPVPEPQPEPEVPVAPVPEPAPVVEEPETPVEPDAPALAPEPEPSVDPAPEPAPVVASPAPAAPVSDPPAPIEGQQP